MDTNQKPMRRTGAQPGSIKAKEERRINVTSRTNQNVTLEPLKMIKWIR